MRWDAVLRPVGPLPVETYWFRRAIVVGAAILAFVLLLIVLRSGGGTKSTLKASPRSSATPSAHGGSATPAAGSTSPPGSASPDSSASQGTGGTACADASLSLAIATVATSYPAGSLPQFVVTVTNTGSAPCTRDVGARERAITIVSGSDRIWSSSDCASTADDVRTLAPGAAVTLPSSWNRERSVPGCTTNPPAGQQAKIGVYVPSVKLGTLGPVTGPAFHIS